jgi:signal peptidase I
VSGPVPGPAPRPPTGKVTRVKPGAHPWWRTLLDWVVVLAIAAGIALLVRTYVVQTYYIPSGSMEPTLHVHDRILVVKAAYDFTSPAVGDIIVFKAPSAEHEKCDLSDVDDLVKRIIATPHDTIYSIGNTIYLNGQPLKQPWQHAPTLGPLAIPRQTVPANDYYVLGDNRTNSCDSRVWGYVPRKDIIGKAVLIFWPLSRLSTL